jgi:hypothetical protein
MMVGGWTVGRKNGMKGTVSATNTVHTNVVLLFQDKSIAPLPIHCKLLNAVTDERAARKGGERLECTQMENKELLLY